jgi:UDP-2-acetamido-2-deoxy-ribo-hexuluronate aminotransferase
MKKQPGSAVPFVNVAAEWNLHKGEALQRIERVFDHGRFVMGPEVDELEVRLARDIGVEHAIACSSGTTALLMALMALDLNPGDEVILPAYTFAAPLEVVLLLGARAVLADIDPFTFTIDPNSVASLIGPRTRAIIAVSLYGMPADFTHLNSLASEHSIPVIEDAAQSYGASLAGRRSGNLSTVGCVSFFPTKTFGGAGDGGAVFTNDSLLGQRLRQIRDHGQSGKYQHVRLGVNGRLGSIACAALLARIDDVPRVVRQRQAVARRYDALLAAFAQCGGLILPAAPTPPFESAFAQYAVQVDARGSVIRAMQAANVQVAVHYPTPLHLQPAFKGRVLFRSLVNAERAAKHALCLPIYPSLTLAQQEQVATALIDAVLAPDKS